jgi:hypothetical protein
VVWVGGREGVWCGWVGGRVWCGWVVGRVCIFSERRNQLLLLLLLLLLYRAQMLMRLVNLGKHGHTGRRMIDAPASTRRQISRALSYLHNFGAKMQLHDVQSLSPRHLAPFSCRIAATSFGFLSCGNLFHLCFQVIYIRAYTIYIIHIM